LKTLRPVALVGFCALAACQPTGGLGTSDSRTPPGVDRRASAEDGLIVGHRLMEAGEHELALRAYMRAASQVGVNAEVLSAIGSANLQLGRLGQAEKILRQAIKEDPTSVPALNNLGVVLMEQGKPAEARIIFQQAFALDSGETDSIRENLRLAIAQSEASVYAPDQEEPTFSLVRRGQGEFVLLSKL
jgi:Flp pilus assembly protein TadD